MYLKKTAIRLCAALYLTISSITLYSKELDDYMQLVDDAYKWHVVKKIQEKDCQVLILSMTSQKWRTEKEVQNPFWNHYIKIIIPQKLTSDTALLMIRGGKNEDPIPEITQEELLDGAINAEAIIAEVFAVPNQPIHFKDETDLRFQIDGRKEDAIIAYSWKKYINTDDPSWPLRMPMTKSVVRAMDAVTQALQKEGISIKDFVLSGESKRGWAAWTTAACDKRVKAIVPVVCDFLNTKELFIHHYNSYGYWSPVLKEYLAADLHKVFSSKSFDNLLGIEDPYSYKDRLDIPKFLISSTGDVFSVVDAMQFYLPFLKGENFVRFIPNSDHYLHKYNYFPSVLSFFNSMAHKKPIPHLKWDWRKPNKLILSCDAIPREVSLWEASNPYQRDFRATAQQVVWKKTSIENPLQNTFTIQMATPEKGWSAYFVEVVYNDEFNRPFPITTEVFVVPIDLPYQYKPEKKP